VEIEAQALNWAALIRSIEGQLSGRELARRAHISRHTLWQLKNNPLFAPRWPTCQRLLVLYNEMQQMAHQNEPHSVL
jgi:DNA-binding XRE family transcriptional regulator